jgi:sec-independent protein translocase protein TatC
MSHGQQTPDPEDLFADTRMSFGDHLEELRTHLWRAIGGFGIAVFVSFFFGSWVLQFIARPVEVSLNRFYDNRVAKVLSDLQQDPNREENRPTEFVQLSFVRKQLIDALNPDKPAEEVSAFPRPHLEGAKTPQGEDSGIPFMPNLGGLFGGQNPEAGGPEGPPIKQSDLVTLWISHKEPLKEVALLQDAQRVVGRRPLLATMNIQEGLVVYFMVCLVCGLVLGSPWIFYQLWAFVAAGLYPHEKRYVHVYGTLSLGLFVGGVILCEFAVMPKAVEALLWFNEWLGLEPDLRLNEWLSFAIWMPVVFGLSFQTPLVMLFLERIGILTVDTYRRHRRIAWFLMAIFAAVITPSTDPISMCLMWVPMCFLFELGIWMCKLKPRQSDFDIDVPDSEEMVEV